MEKGVPLEGQDGLGRGLLLERGRGEPVQEVVPFPGNKDHQSNAVVFDKLLNGALKKSGRRL